MYGMTEKKEGEKPPQAPQSAAIKQFPRETPPLSASQEAQHKDSGFLHWILKLTGRERNGHDLREALEEFIEEAENDENGAQSPLARHERSLVTNVLNLRDATVLDVMVPRADIVAIDINTSQADLLALLSQKQFSRIPVYRETMDDILGTIHIKDIIAALAQGRQVEIEELVREAPIVSPAMPVLDLMLMMKHMKKHMALVVDEFGGIDGLVTIGDVIEAIIGEIEDEHATYDEPKLRANKDGSILADGRYDIEELEKKYGSLLTEDEREDIDTLGGLAFELAGRIPARGEILTHGSGMVLEIVDADPRRVKKILLRNIPQKPAG